MVAVVLMRRGWRSGRSAPHLARNHGSDVPTARVKRGDLDMKVYETGELRASHSEMLIAPPIGEVRCSSPICCTLERPSRRANW